MDGHVFLEALAIVMCVAAVTTVIFQRLHQPVVLGYILAGLIVGPHVPLPLVADADVVQTLSELGVILLMFSLGLEFSLRQLLKVGPRAGLTAVVQCSIMVWLGFLVGQAFGWTWRESLYTGAIIAISSTTIIAKVFDEQRIGGPLRELVVGVLIVEDLIAVLLMALLTALSSRAGPSAAALAHSVGRLAAFLVGLVVVGMLVVPRAIRAIVRLDRPETTLVASIGICFASALLALELRYSVALGAFIAGSLVAESGEARRVEHLVGPVKDMFAAVFFVSVGMLIDPALVLRHWPAVLVLTLVVIAGKVLSVSAGAFLAGSGTRTSVQSGMSLAQIGEFSFIIASLGISLGATRPFLYALAVAVSAITTLTTPWLIRLAEPVARWVDRRLPRPLQTFAALYGTWVDRIRALPGRETRGAGVRRLVGFLLLDAALLGVIAIGASVWSRPLALLGQRELGIAAGHTRLIGMALSLLLALPFCFGVLRIARRLGLVLALAAFPAAVAGAGDRAAAPRRALVVTLQLATVLVVGLPLVALTQPFSGPQSALVLAVLVLVIGVSFWRSATDLEGHVRAGVQTIVEVLARQAGTEADRGGAPATLATALPGLGEAEQVRLEDGCAAVGRTLAGLDLRGVTGATVLAIVREGGPALVPGPHEVLKAGDVLAVTGTREAVAQAESLLRRG